MKESIDTIIKWHTETFPEATLEGQLAKWDEEAHEFKYSEPLSDEALGELADMTIVSAGIARFDYGRGLDALVDTLLCFDDDEWTTSELWQAVEKKMEKNRRRVWEKQNGMYQHKAGIED